MPGSLNYYANDERNIQKIKELRNARKWELQQAELRRKKIKDKALLKEQRHEKQLERRRKTSAERKEKYRKKVIAILKWRKYGYNLNGIGIKLGVTGERVRQIIDKYFTDEQQNEFFHE